MPGANRVRTFLLPAMKGSRYKSKINVNRIYKYGNQRQAGKAGRFSSFVQLGAGVVVRQNVLPTSGCREVTTYSQRRAQTACSANRMLFRALLGR